MVNDNLERRGLYTEVFPENSKMCNLHFPKGTYTNGKKRMPIPFDTNVKPTRVLKSQFRNSNIMVKGKGFNFVIRFTSNDGFANLYAHIVVGEPIIFSYEIDSDNTFSFPFDNVVESVSVSDSQISFNLFCDSYTSSDGKSEYEAISQTFTIKNSSKDFSNGIEGKVSVKAQNYFGETSKTSAVLNPFHINTISNLLVINFTQIEQLAKESSERVKAFKDSHLKMSETVTYYYNENSFLDIENPDNYLQQEKADFKSVKNFGKDEYVELTLAIEGSTDATDNYTGINETNNLLVKIILPDEFRSLSPMTQEADGLNFSKGRVTEQRFKDGQALFSFSDSSECVIPNPEDKSFHAEDRNGQILIGKVIGLELKKGNSAEALREQIASRKLNNLNKEYSFDVEGELELDSIAWVTGKKNDFIKMIVPTQDEKGNEMFKVVNINIGEL